MKYPYMVNFEGKYYPAGTDVPVETPVKVELTDDVPEGALEDNPDGSVKTYDAEGNFAGFISREEAERALETAGEDFEVQKAEVMENIDEMPENDDAEPQNEAEKVQEEAKKPKRSGRSKEA